MNYARQFFASFRLWRLEIEMNGGKKITSIRNIFYASFNQKIWSNKVRKKC